MSKLINEVLEQVVMQGENPIEIIDQGKELRVGVILDRWYDTGCWWEGESSKLFFRLQLEGERVWEIYQDLADRCWHIYKIYD
ncbi:MAG: hypothetical protein ACM3QW_04895 [Ignavibacteriales bacterium]